jgi:transcriptional regulator with XRE-family HTH domain
MNQFSKNLRLLRKEKRLTQEQMAKYLNITQQAYARYEKGDTEPSYNTLITLSNFFRISLDHLLLKQLNETPTINNTFKNNGVITGGEFNIGNNGSVHGGINIRQGF